MKKEYIKYCVYCKKTSSEIRKERREEGYRVACPDRLSPKGFHKMVIKKIANKESK